MTPSILFEDQDIIVCRKPPGVPTQSSHIGSPDMVSILKNHLHKEHPQKQPPYLAVIHRLDQPVEGLLVFAKTTAAAKVLNKQLTQYGFGKYYRALLEGTPGCMEATLEDYLLKDGRSNTSHICPSHTTGAKRAVLHYKILESSAHYSLAEITLKTGRHHQIRVQMANMGTPIAGDKKYSGAQTTDSVPGGHCNRSDYKNLQLFACRLSFCHPRTNQPMEYQLDSLRSIKDL